MTDDMLVIDCPECLQTIEWDKFHRHWKSKKHHIAMGSTVPPKQLKPRNLLALSAPGRVAEPTPNFPHLWEPDEIDEIEVADEVFGNAGIFEFPHQQLNV